MSAGGLHLLVWRSWLRPTLLLGLALGLAACAGGPPAVEQSPAAAPPEQPLALRVLDGLDRPLAGAEAVVVAFAGQPRDPGPYRSDDRGLIDLPWRPQVVAETGPQTADRLLAYVSRLDYRVQAPGYMPAEGRLEQTGKSRRLAQKRLQGLDAEAVLVRRTQTVVLHRRAEILGRGLSDRSPDDPLVARCLAYYDKNHDLAVELGTSFAWPGFTLQGRRLAVRLDWRGQTWSALSKAPLAAQVALSTSLPLAITLGEDLLPAPGVEDVSLDIISVIPPQGADPHAPPVHARVSLEAPVADLLALAKGALAPESFLRRHPPRLVEEGALAVTPFGETR